MNRYAIGLSAIALGLAGTAMAAMPQAGMGPMGDKDISRAEFLAKHGQMFDKLDANHDGKLDAADRAAHQAQKFDKVDSDHNGAISREEFSAALEHRKQARKEHQAGGHGKSGDDGMRGRSRGGHGKMMMMMLHHADANKDHAVSREEFMSGAGRHFDMMDANKDGKLTKDERKAAHEKMKAMMQHGPGGHGGAGEHGGHGGHGDMPPPPPPPGG